MMAAAAFAAGTFLQIGFGRDASEFERFGNKFLDGILHRVQFLLRINKTPRDGIFQQHLAMLLEIGNLRAFKRLSAMLLFMEHLAFFRQSLVIIARRGVGKKSVNAFADRRHFRLGDDGLAEFFSLFFDFCGHKIKFCADNKSQFAIESNWIDTADLNR